MTENNYLETLVAVRAALVSERREFATGALKSNGTGSYSKKGQLESLLETQRDIEVLDKAIDDERKLAGSSYNLDNIV